MSLILVHSPKGGVGTTTLVAALALAFARRGGDVAALDLTGQDALGLHLGVRQDPAARGNAGYEQQADDDVVVIAGARFVSIGQGAAAGADAPALVERFAQSGALVIADIAAGDDEALAALLPMAALHLCVLAPHPGSVALLPRMLSTRVRGITRFLLNGLDNRTRLARDVAGFLQATLGGEMIGAIRRDEAVSEALAMIEPISTHAPQSAALGDIEGLADRIADILPDVLPSENRAGGAAA